jgi:hypothetical protein
MTMSEVSRPRRSLGKLSVQIALGIFAAATVLLIAFLQIPEKTLLYDLAGWVVVIAIGVAAPLGHLAGFVLGLVALFRSGDRRGLGVLGILLNAVVVAFGLFLIVMGFSHLSPR